MTTSVVFVCSEKGQVKQMNTIQDLYYGRISPYEMSISDEQKELLDKLTECITYISSISERDMFIAGFRLGVKLMIDVMKND